MMFFGPTRRTRPPKNTCGSDDCSVSAFSTGMPCASKSMPALRSIHGKAFSWPTATSTSSHSKISSGSPVGTSWRRPRSSRTARTRSKLMPVRRPLASWMKARGTRQSRMGMPSCSASSFSHGEAFISSKGERTMTFTSSAPRRRAVRQQSIAVLPPPSTITRLAAFVTWPNETDDSQSMPMWMCAAACARPGIDRSRPRGAPEPTNTASQFSSSNCCIDSMRCPPRKSTPSCST